MDKPDAPAVEILSRLASEIWHQHFITIISAEQIDYMLEQFQSSTAITRQLAEEGYVYYIAYEGAEPLGYAGIVPKEEERAIFLSKIYIKEQHRGRGLSRLMIERFLEDLREYPYERVYLTCNRHNDNSIAAYKHMGFIVTDEVVKEIGQDMVMDDYIMTLYLPPQS